MCIVGTPGKRHRGRLAATVRQLAQKSEAARCMCGRMDPPKSVPGVSNLRTGTFWIYPGLFLCCATLCCLLGEAYRDPVLRTLGMLGRYRRRCGGLGCCRWMPQRPKKSLLRARSARCGAWKAGQLHWSQMPGTCTADICGFKCSHCDVRFRSTIARSQWPA